MACNSLPLTLSTTQTGDLGLDQAIYHSGTGKIFGVRGQWLFRFNATTAALEASLRFIDNGGGLSSISSIGNNLYLGTSFVTNDDVNSVNPALDRDIYIVDATTFLNSGRFNFDTAHLNADMGFPAFSDWYSLGWMNLITNGTFLWGVEATAGIWRVDPTALGGFISTNLSRTCTDIAYDSINGAIWATICDAPNVHVEAQDFSNSCNDTGGVGVPTGICCVTVAGATKVYFVNGTFSLGMVVASAALPAFVNFPVTTFNTGQINANPYKVKAINGLVGNPLNGKVLIPAFADNTVIVWDPVLDALSGLPRTGFTSPFDIVSTPTKNFAVQTGTVGLKEIV